ncbi:glycosyltransferase family 4 protein [Chloroflexi bacterium TSY]|nr:glycosyltransferase family 4 protein [Chloroflexi bacterium TSY]
MRILFCNYEYPPLGGGGGIINAHLAQELAKTHDVTVLTSQALGLPERIVEGGVDVLRAPVFFRKQEAVATMSSLLAFIPTGIRLGKKLLETQKFDIINTHFVVPTGPVGHTLARRAQIPNVLSLHGGDLYDPSKFFSPHRHALFRPFIRYLLRQADVVLGQSIDTLQNMHQHYSPNIDAIRIPLAIRRPNPEKASRADYGFCQEDKLLITIGRLVSRKNIDQLITMLHEIHDHPTPVHLLIVGSGPQEEHLRTLAAEMQVTDRVHFLGFIDDDEKMRLLHMCDLYVSTSQHEGFGLVFLEAMACGLPVICYDHGGQTDFLTDNETGHLIPLDNLPLFTERVLALLKDDHAQRRMDDICRKRVEEYFIDTCAKQHEAIYEQVIRAYQTEDRVWSLHEHTVSGIGD